MEEVIAERVAMRRGEDASFSVDVKAGFPSYERIACIGVFKGADGLFNEVWSHCIIAIEEGHITRFYELQACVTSRTCSAAFFRYNIDCEVFIGVCVAPFFSYVNRIVGGSVVDDYDANGSIGLPSDAVESPRDEGGPIEDGNND